MKKIIILLGILVIIVIGGWYVFTRTVSAPTVSPITTTVSPTSSTAPLSATVNYSANGFTPKIITIKQGGVVTFKSIDGSPMWVASGVHPTHLLYDGTDLSHHCGNALNTAFDQCSNGTSYIFTFLKVGEWRYHNHMNAGEGGVIIVVQ